MANFVPVSLYLQYGEVCQYLSTLDIATQQAFKGGAINDKYPQILRAVRKPIQWAYDRNPNDPTLNATALYLYQLLGNYRQRAANIINNQAQAKPVITGPTNQSVSVGNTATFSVTVTSSLTVTYQWYLNGVIIPGATSLSYLVTNAQLVQSGGLYSVAATNAAGTTTSNQASLTVSAGLVALTWYGDVDPNPDLQAGIDNLSYQITTNITHNQPIVITIPQVATPNKWFVTKVVSTESLKTIWNNGPFNNGTINPPDGVFNAQIQFGGLTFYPTHQAISLDFNTALTLS